jgi:hypothetical protein
MEYTGFELALSDYEKGFLTAHFEAHLRFEDYRSNNNAWWESLTDDNEWVGVQIGNRMFDICIWMQDNDEGPNYPDDLVAVVHECTKTSDGCWQTDTSTSFFLKEAE